jgi:hypothetical protein
MWVFVTKVWSAGQPAGFSDLFARWWGSHELLLHHADPYSPMVTRQIQTTIYGAPLTSSPTDPLAQHSGGFAYPIYTAFLFWPRVGLSFPVVKIVFACLLPVLTLAAYVLWVCALQWKPDRNELIIGAVFYMGSFPALQALRLQNLSVLVAFLIAAAMVCLKSNRLSITGFLLACSTIKPHFVALLLVWLAIWVFHDWKTRRTLAYSFIATLGALVLGGEYFLWGWIGEFRNIVSAYQQYTYGHSLLDVWFSTTSGHLAAIALSIAAVWLCWRWKSFPASTAEFFLICSILLATTVLVIPTLEPHAQLLLAPGFLLLFRYRAPIWALGKSARLLTSAAWMLLAWPWLAAALLTTAVLCGRVALAARFWLVPLSTSPMIPLGLLGILAFLLGKCFRTKHLIWEP